MRIRETVLCWGEHVAWGFSKGEWTLSPEILGLCVCVPCYSCVLHWCVSFLYYSYKFCIEVVVKRNHLSFLFYSFFWWWIGFQAAWQVLQKGYFHIRNCCEFQKGLLNSISNIRNSDYCAKLKHHLNEPKRLRIGDQHFNVYFFLPYKPQYPSSVCFHFSTVPLLGLKLTLCLLTFSFFSLWELFLWFSWWLCSPVPLECARIHRRAGFTMKHVKRDQCQQSLRVTTLLASGCQACQTALTAQLFHHWNLTAVSCTCYWFRGKGTLW